MNIQSAKNFALQIGALICLFTSLWAMVSICFGLSNIFFPNDVEYSWELANSQNTVRYGIALLVVFFPTFLLLTRKVNQMRRADPDSYHNLTRWIVYLALVVGGIVLLGNLVAVIFEFLNGELTNRFALRSGSLLAIVGVAFVYYLKDTRGYWDERPKASIWVGIGSGVVALALVIVGFLNIDSPAKVREVKLDERQVSDLQEIQYNLEAYYQKEQALPESLDQVYVDILPPQAPAGRAAYRYQATGADTYNLCATFAYVTPGETARETEMMNYDRGLGYYPSNYDWTHAAGEKCFERKVMMEDELLRY